MSDEAFPPKITLQGLNVATADWLSRPDSAKAVSAATQLVKEHHWNLLSHPEGMEQASLLLAGEGTAVAFLADPAPNPEQIQSDLEEWAQKAKAYSKRWSNFTLLYITSEEVGAELQESLEKAVERVTLGGVFRALVYHEPSNTFFGKTPRALEEVSLETLQGDLRELLTSLLQHELQMKEFREKVAGVTPWGTYAVMALCVASFAWATAAGGTENTLVLLRFGANYQPLTEGAGQWWRLLGSAFMHIGVVHILVNMYSLYAVGPALESFLGNLRYLTVYTLSALGGSLASVHFGGDHVSAGASGAIFGLFGASVALGMRHRDKIPRPIQRALVKGMLPAIGYNLLFGFSVPGIDNAAHLGGLLSGAVASFLIPPALAKPILPSPLRALFAACACALLLNQGFTLFQAYQGFQFRSLPARTVQIGRWTFQIPKLFEASSDKSHFQGPGVNLFANSELGEVGDPESVATQLSEEIGFPVRYESSEEYDGRPWHFYTSANKVAGYFALTESGGEHFMVGTFCPLEEPESGRQVVLDVLPSVQGP